MTATIETEMIELLRSLIRTPSFSREEQQTAQILVDFFAQRGLSVKRTLNNVWLVNRSHDLNKPTLLLNSHHDTVKPNPQYTRDPFEPSIEGGQLFGLGSNDAGGPLVSLIGAFLHLYERADLPFNLVLAATAEEEISGYQGIVALLDDPDFVAATRGGFWGAIVGEPTQMQLAVSEKGLMVIDAVAYGKAGHAAREEGTNAIYKALQDIQWISHYAFPKISPTLGSMKMSVTVMQTENKAHNVVPAECRFVVDMRLTDAYTHEEALGILQANLQSELTPRSMRMRATVIPDDHPLVQAGRSMGKQTYGSPTGSDKALMPFPALKCGPGDSARSHSADEFIYLSEIQSGIRDYVTLIESAASLFNPKPEL